jgi:hypothetical protein
MFHDRVEESPDGTGDVIDVNCPKGWLTLLLLGHHKLWPGAIDDYRYDMSLMQRQRRLSDG